MIANAAHKKVGSKFVQLSATTSGVSDVKEAVKVARNHKSLLKKKTLLFVDEIHRFNKLQQVCMHRSVIKFYPYFLLIGLPKLVSGAIKRLLSRVTAYSSVR